MSKIKTMKDYEMLRVSVDDLDKTIMQLPDSLKQVGEAFAHNLRGVKSVVNLPFTLASASTANHRLDRLHLAEIFRTMKELPLGANLSDEQKQLAWERANLHLSEEIKSKDAMDYLVKHTESFLEGALHDSDFVRAADELLRQGVVLIWGTFEALARDLLVASVNSNSSLVSKLRQNEKTKRSFGLSKIEFETLASYGFDLSSKLGNFLSEQHDFGNVHTIRETFVTIFGNEVLTIMADDRLRKLSVQRHVIVHNRGIADKRYLSESRETTAEGESIRIRSKDLEEYMSIVSEAGKILLTAATKAVSGG